MIINVLIQNDLKFNLEIEICKSESQLYITYA